MHFLVLRAIETCGCQIVADEAQTSYGLSVLPNEKDRMCSPCSTRDSMQVRFDFNSQIIYPPFWYHIVLTNLTMTLFVWPRTACDFLPCGLTLSSAGHVAQPMRQA